MGDRGASNMGDVRPRSICPTCARSIAVTFNSKTGEAYYRTHVSVPKIKCPRSRRPATRGSVFQPPREDR